MKPAKMADPNDPPKFLLPSPKPMITGRKFNRAYYTGWQGYMRLTDLTGWPGNPRLDVPVDQFSDRNGRLPTDRELLDILIEYNEPAENDDVELGEEEKESARRSKRNRVMLLAKNIRINGVREPLILTSQLKLLDGNRRYFSCLYLQMTAPPEDSDRDNYTKLPVWVLPEDADLVDEDRVIVEMNFVDDGRTPWPYWVKAQHVYRDHVDNKMTVDQLAEKYHTWTKSRIRQVIEAAKVAESFIAHHDSLPEARDLAYRHLIWFDELQRNNSKSLGKEQFRSTIFDMIMESADADEEQRHFRRSRDFVRLGEIYEDEEAWEVLTSTRGHAAIEKAEFVVDRKRFEDKSDADDRMKRANQLLKSLVEGQRFSRVAKSTLDEFQSIALQVPGGPAEVVGRVGRLLEWLDSLTSAEMAQIPADMQKQLNQALERVTRQIGAYRP